jgi:metal-responsive CopG/Arc/MetJ family transcriptional regulator
MRATVSIEKNVLDELRNATGAKTRSAAVRKVIEPCG